MEWARIIADLILPPGAPLKTEATARAKRELMRERLEG